MLDVRSKRCNFRHPKNCKYIMKSVKCKFGVFCSFEHEIHGLVLQEDKEEKIKTLENLIVDEDIEIERLKAQLSESNIFHLDGDFTIEDNSDYSDADFLDEIEDTSNSEEQESFRCDQCAFTTEHRKGLKIHITRTHKSKCEECELTFKDEDCLNRHLDGKQLISNIDPHVSPDKALKLKMLRKDEKCLVIHDEMLNQNLLQLHSWSCWSREEHSCQDLPPENVLVYPHHSTKHTDIGLVVMGDLSVAGCYMDWDIAKTIIDDGQNKA